MASKLAEAYILLRVQQDNLASQLSQARGQVVVSLAGMENAAKGAAGSAAQTQTAFAASISAAAVLANAATRAYSQMAGAAQKYLDLYFAQEGAEARLGAVLKATGNAAGFSAEQIIAYAKELQNSTTYSDEATISAAAVMATFRDVQGPAFKQGIALAQDMSAVFGQDLQSSVVQISKALNMPVQGISSLARVGVQFSKSQKEQIENFVAMNNIAGAQGVILKELQMEFGGAAAAMANTAGGKFQQTLNTIKSFGERIGKALVPAMNAIIPLVLKLGEFFTSAIESLPPGVIAAAGAFAALAGAVGSVAVLAPILAPAFSAIGSVVAGLLGPLGLVAAAAVALGASFYQAMSDPTQGSQITAALASIWDSIKGVASAVMAAFGDIGASLSPLLGTMSSGWAGFFQGIARFIAENKATVQRWILLWGEYISGFIALVTPLLQGWFGMVGSMWSNIGSLAKAIWDSVRSYITTALEVASVVVNNFGLTMRLIWTQIQLSAMEVFDAIGNAFWQMVAVGTGAGAALAASFTATWHNMQAAYEAADAAVRAGFSGLVAAKDAALKGENPITAYRESYSKELAKLTASNKDFQSAGDAAAQAFTLAYNQVIADHPPGEDAATGALRAERDKLADELGGAVARMREAREARIAAMNAPPGTAPGAGAAAAPGAAAAAGAEAKTPEIKIAFVGFAEMWKKVQDGITGTGATELAKLTANNTAKTATAAEKTATAVEAARDAIEKLNLGLG